MTLLGGTLVRTLPEEKPSRSGPLFRNGIMRSRHTIAQGCRLSLIDKSLRSFTLGPLCVAIRTIALSGAESVKEAFALRQRLTTSETSTSSNMSVLIVV